MFIVEVKMSLNSFKQMMHKLNISYIENRINKYILHIVLFRDNDEFRLRFVDSGEGFEFTNFIVE